MFGNVDTSSDARVRELRKCGKCAGGSVTVVHVTQHYNRGVPAGRSYQHRCGGCQATFESLSTWRALLELFFGSMLAVIGFGMCALTVASMFDHGIMAPFADGGSIGRTVMAVLLLAGGTAWAGFTTWKVLNLMINYPVVGQR
jgi:hypothetical protein